ncbi:MAG: hypothetical protein AABY22_26260 [Nanoarchaeota archaeon]
MKCSFQNEKFTCPNDASTKEKVEFKEPLEMQITRRARYYCADILWDFKSYFKNIFYNITIY